MWSFRRIGPAVELAFGTTLFASLALFFSLAPPQSILVFMPDDLGYFLKVAENVAAGRGTSFDGLDLTTGFQPLWLALLVPLAKATSGMAQESVFRLALLMQLVLLAIAASILRRAHAARFTPETTALSTLLFGTLVVIQAANGMESALLVLLLAVLLYTASRWGIGAGAGPFAHVAFGVLVGLVMLARVDMVFFGGAVVAVVFLAALANGSRKEAVLAASAVLAGAVIVVLPYLFFNIAVSGHAVPISGKVKSSFPVPYRWQHVTEKFDTRTLAFAALALGLTTYYASRWLRAAARRQGQSVRVHDAAVAALAVGVAGHAFYTLLFSNWVFFFWQFIPYSVLASVGVSAFVDRGLRSTRFGGRGLQAALVLVFALLLGYSGRQMWQRLSVDPDNPPKWAWHAASYEAAVWVREHLPPATVLAIEHAGIFGYFSARPVINLDGVANNFVYQDAVREQRLGEYLGARGVTYVARHGFDRPDVTDARYTSFPLSIVGRTSMKRSEALVFRRDEEVYRSRPYPDDDVPTVFVIWNMRFGGDRQPNGSAPGR